MMPRRAPTRRMLAALACAATFVLATPARTEDGLAPIPAAEGYLNDGAHVIGEARAAQLESFLDQLQRRTGVQFAVLTMDSVAPEPPEQYKVRAFKAWGIGGAEQDEGLLLLVALHERRVVFETGYGLEGTLPDGWQAGMLRDLLVPRFRTGEYADGITLAVIASAQRIAESRGTTITWTGDALRYDSTRRSRRGLPPIVLAFVILFAILVLLSATRSGRRGYSSAGPWMGGGLGGWGGGFGGGGGGGGGDSFGGFGGGGSGGGGGGAGW